MALPNLVGLCGMAGHGKTTIANMLVEKYGFKKFAFADPLKEMLLNAEMCTKEELWGKKTEKSRWLLQKIGTDIFRNQVNKNFWVVKLELMIGPLIDTTRIVVDDIRMPNEATLIKRLGGTLVLVERYGYVDDTAGALHDSEALVKDIAEICDVVFGASSGDVQALLERANSFFSAYGGVS